jgi:hypothetical protein
MKKQTDKKLKLSRETMRLLTEPQTRNAAAGDDITCESTCFGSCPYSGAPVCGGENG